MVHMQWMGHTLEAMHCIGVLSQRLHASLAPAMFTQHDLLDCTVQTAAAQGLPSVGFHDMHFLAAQPRFLAVAELKKRFHFA